MPRNNKTESNLARSWKMMWTKPFILGLAAYTLALFFIAGSLLAHLGENLFGNNIELTHNNLTNLSIFFLGSFLAIFFIINHVTSLRVAVYWQLAQKKNITIQQAIITSTQLFWKTTKVVLIKIVLTAILPITYLLITTQIGTSTTTQPVLNILLLILTIILSIIITAWLIFIEPMIIAQKKGVIDIYKESWHNLMTKRKEVWMTTITYIGLSILIFTVTSIIGISLELTGQEAIWTLISTLINTILGTWLLLYIYNSYVTRLHHVRH